MENEVYYNADGTFREDKVIFTFEVTIERKEETTDFRPNPELIATLIKTFLYDITKHASEVPWMISGVTATATDSQRNYIES
jgi:hypothetical protein